MRIHSLSLNWTDTRVGRPISYQLLYPREAVHSCWRMCRFKMCSVRLRQTEGRTERIAFSSVLLTRSVTAIASVRLFPLYLRNRLTVNLELLHASRS